MEFTLLWQTKMKSSARPAVCWEEQKAAGRGGQHRAQQRCSEAADSSGVSEGSSNSLKSRKCAQQGDVRGFVCSTPPWRQEGLLCMGTRRRAGPRRASLQQRRTNSGALPK